MSVAGAKFPWQRMMDYGLRELRLVPTEFWRSTLRELIPQRSAPPSAAMLRQTLDELMNLWPDENHDT